MRRILYLFIYIAATVMLFGCKSNKSSEQNVIYVSIAPLKPIIEGIVGDDYTVRVLVPQGASPETFEPTPKQFIALNESAMIFSIGLLDFEKALLERVHDQSKIVNLSTGVVTIAGSCSHTHHGKHCHHGIDPHIWCSPKSLTIMASNAYSVISSKISKYKYTKNYSALTERLTALDQQVTELCNNSLLPYFIIYHPALTYIARDYGLEQVAIEKDGKEPSVKQVAQIIDRARTSGVKRIFYQSEFPQSSVAIFADDIGAEAVEINPLAEDIFTNIPAMVTLITE